MGNEVASVGWVGEKGNSFTFLTIHTRLTIAQQYTSATIAPTAQTSHPRRNKLNESYPGTKKAIAE